MKKTKKKNTFRWKLAGIAALSAVAGVLFMFLCIKVAPSDETDQASTTMTPTTTAPTDTAPADADEGSGPLQSSPEQQAKKAAQNMSGLLLILSLLSFAVTIICLGWIVVDIRQSRPAWKMQTKYPKRR